MSIRAMISDISIINTIQSNNVFSFLVVAILFMK